MSDYTPTTDDVRDRWSLGHTKNGAHFTTEAFDRWLAARDAARDESVRAEERERIARSIATSEVAAHETQVARIAAERDSWHQAALLTTADLGRVEHERDEARGKLDKVRRLIPTENPELIEAGYGIDSRDVLAILDE